MSNTIEITTTMFGKYGQIGVLKGFNMNSTADQIITLVGGTKFIVTDIVITNVSTSLTSAVGFAIWTLPSHGGVELGENTANLNLLTSSTTFMNVSSAPNVATKGMKIYGNVCSTNTVYASLGTPQGSAATADIYIYGYILA